LAHFGDYRPSVEPRIGVGDSVSVTIWEVSAGRVPLSVNGDRAAGGLRAPVNETYVQLSRGSATVRGPMTRVASDPQENIYLRPNDVLSLISGSANIHRLWRGRPKRGDSLRRRRHQPIAGAG
jgi:protein involved in polysaccharide export with SLBB domain